MISLKFCQNCPALLLGIVTSTAHCVGHMWEPVMSEYSVYDSYIRAKSG